MNINASIIDQQVRALADRLRDQFVGELNIQNDEDRLRSASFVLLTVSKVLDLDETDAFDCLVDGGQDFGADAIHVSDVMESEFTVTLFQGKYKRDLEGTAQFPETGVTKSIQAARFLFDPDATLSLNDRLAPRIEEIRSLIRDGNLPRVRYVLCNNGLSWNSSAQQLIDNEGFPDRVVFEHINHDMLVRLMQAAQPIDDTLRFTGKAFVEDFDYLRAFVGKVAVTDVADLLRRHGDRLLERNIRRYLGIYGNRVNAAIQATLRDPDQRPNFYFFNNGLTLICRHFDYNALQGQNYQVQVKDLQIINGGQTCKTIEVVLGQINGDTANLDKAFVLVRLYQLPESGPDLVRSITYATNSQNPVDLRNLRSNDELQRALEMSIEQLGFRYRRKRSDESYRALDITPAVAAEAVLSVWRNRPHQAKFMSGEHFGKLYSLIFDATLNGAQTIIAVRLFRSADARRRRPPEAAPIYLSYCLHYAAMRMGQYLLHERDLKLGQIDHRNFADLMEIFAVKGQRYMDCALTDIETALAHLYGDRYLQTLSLQRLSAAFRRADLAEELRALPIMSS